MRTFIALLAVFFCSCSQMRRQNVPSGNGISHALTAKIISVTPQIFPSSGGTKVAIAGTDFQNGAVVSFVPNSGSGSLVSCSNVQVIGSTQITCVSPALIPGVSYTITVHNPGETSSTSSSPTPVSVSDSGSTSTTTSTSTSGSGGNPPNPPPNPTNTSTSTSTSTSTNTSSTSTSTSTSGDGSSGGGTPNPTATSTGTSSGSGNYSCPANGATGPGPTASFVSPQMGSTAGGFILTIVGKGVAYACGITVGGVNCPLLSPEGPDALSCIAPSLPPGLADVVVSLYSGSTTLKGIINYSSNPPQPSFNHAKGFDGAATKVLLLSDGSLLVGGLFTTFGSQLAPYIIRLNPDGTVNSQFMSGVGFDYSVLDMALSDDGTNEVFVAGQFSTYQKQAVSCVVKLKLDGSLDPSFKIPNCYYAKKVRVAQDGSHKVYVASAQTIYRYDPDGSLDSAFLNNLAATFSVPMDFSDAPNMNGKVYVYGMASGKRRLFRLNSDGTVDPTFSDSAPTLSNYEIQFAAADGGRLYAADSSNYDFHRYNLDGSVDSTFQPAKIPEPVDHYELEGGASVRLTGYLATGLSSYQYNMDGSLGSSFASTLSSSLTPASFTFDASGRLYLGSAISSQNGNSANGLARFNSDGTFDASFNLGAGLFALATPAQLAHRGADEIYVAANGAPTLFAANAQGMADPAFQVSSSIRAWKISPLADGTGRFMVVTRDLTTGGTVLRLNADGSVDPSFASFSLQRISPGAVQFNVNALSVDANNNVYVGGYNIANTTIASFLVRLTPSGALDNTFSPPLLGEYLNVAVATPSGIYVAAQSSTAVVVPPLMRLNANGSIDGTFSFTSTNFSRVNSIALLPDGRLYVGGQTSATGIQGLLRLNPDGSLDSTFLLTMGATFFEVNDISLAADGSNQLYVSYGTHPYPALTRINPDGTADSTFVTGYGFTHAQHSGYLRLLPMSDGTLYVGGGFSSYNGVTTNGLIHLSPSGELE